MPDSETLPADGETQRTDTPASDDAEPSRDSDNALQNAPAQVDEKTQEPETNNPPTEDAKKEEPVDNKPAPYAPSIAPTVGRVVLYTPPLEDHFEDAKHAPKHAATIAKVLPNGTLNLGILSENGNHYARQGVPLIQDGELKPDGGNYAEWMPYQKGQAAKTEELEKKLEGV